PFQGYICQTLRGGDDLALSPPWRPHRCIRRAVENYDRQAERRRHVGWSAIVPDKQPRSREQCFHFAQRSSPQTLEFRERREMVTPAADDDHFQTMPFFQVAPQRNKRLRRPSLVRSRGE